MTRNLKVLGLALVAVLAMSATVASAASAASFTASNGAGTKISAEDTGYIQFTVTGQSFTCGKAVFQGTAPAPSFAELKLTAAYAECKTGLGTTATITGFGQHGEKSACYFVIQTDGKADLVCPAGQEVTIDAATCVVHIPGQNNVGTLTYANASGAIDVNINLTKLTANHTDGFLCPFPKTETTHDSSTTLETVNSPLRVIPASGTLVWDA